MKFRYVDVGGQQSDLKTVTTDAQGFANFTHSYPLSPDIKNGKIQMVGQGPVFLSNWADFEIDCSAPPQDVVTVLPPKAVSVEAHATAEEIMHHQGFSCPEKVKVYGVLKGRGAASGAAALFADGKLKKLQQYSIEDGQAMIVEGEHDLDWSSVHAFGGAVPHQNVKLAMNVTNATADLVDQMERTQEVACRQVQTSGVAQGAAGGVSPGKPAPSQSQQAAVGQLVMPQAFAIQAPKGLVHKGEIRLSGGAANAKYTLKFFRKNGGGYASVNAAQLPKQMTGLVAGFPLKALTGGRDWRLEVCPAQQGQGACKTADFRLPRIGGGGAMMKAPAPSAKPASQPKGATVFIVPGALK